MTNIITGPGEYRTRDGELKKIVGPSNTYNGWYATSGETYYSDGDCLVGTKPRIVGPWKPDTTAERQGFEPFWIVLKQGPQNQQSKKHDSFGKAAGEATRRAKEDPGVTFYVLKATHEYTASVTVNSKEARDD